MYLEAQQNPLTQPQSSATVGLTGELTMVLVLAAIVALPVSIGLLSRYRRAVVRSMHERSHEEIKVSPPPELSASPAEPGQAVSDLPNIDRAPSPMAGKSTDLGTLLRAPWQAAAIYAVAGLCYALVMAAASLASWRLGFIPFRLLVSVWIFAWPVIPTIGLVAAATRRARLAITVGYVVVLAILGAIAIVRSPTVSFGSIAVLWAINNLPSTVLIWAFLNRRVRAVGPLVLAFLVLAFAGSIVVLHIVGSDAGLLRSVADLGSQLGVGGVGAFMGLVFLGFVMFGLIGWLMLRWIGDRYEHKKISDQSVTIDSMWLLFGVVQSIPLVFGGAGYILSGLVSFAAYKVICRVGFGLMRRDTAPEDSPRLLLLRVFSLGKRSERLFDALAKHWRHVGPIRMIAGPDLATTTIEPHEFLDFLTGKLARRFVDAPETLDLRISEMDLRPDRDGRFRINDFFCHEDTWQMTLSRLVDQSDVVLMDLRGFAPQNRGVVHEIDKLIDVVPLERVQFVIDQTTDEQFLRQTVEESWDKMSATSPNRYSTPEQLRPFWITGSHGGELRHLLAALSGAASVETVRSGAPG